MYIRQREGGWRRREGEGKEIAENKKGGRMGERRWGAVPPVGRGSREEEERVGWCRIDRSRAEKGGAGKRRGAGVTATEPPPD